jgi:serine/threonine protein kinase
VSGNPKVGGYELEEELGRGAIGAVYRGRSPDGEPVAVKVLDAALGGDDAFWSRFEREAHVATEVRHAHLVSVLDAGVDDGRPYLVLELAGGGSLADRLHDGPLPLRDAVRVVTQVATGLDALHRADIVHRDVKPSNIMLREDGSAALTDFGLAKGATYTALTKPGRVLGTLDYLAPELVRGGEATRATDIYALGCVAFETVSGRPPFADRSLLGVGTAHLADDPPEPPVGSAMSWALLRALEKDPAARPPTAIAYAQLLRAAFAEQQRG